MNKLESAIQGCILGTAVADAIGLPYEGLSRQRIKKLVTGPLKHRFFFGRGMVSDDTEHTCMVAQALLVSGGEPALFAKQLAKRFRWWLLGLPAGVGLATGRSILKLWLGVSPAKSGVWSAGNGPAMRSAVIGVYASDNDEQLTELVTKSTMITHRDPRALKGAMIVAKAAAYNASMKEFDLDDSVKAILPIINNDEELYGLIDKAITSAKNKESAYDFCKTMGFHKGVSGYIYQTLPVACQIWLRYPRDYESAITEAVMCGGDTDTVAAIVGGMVGAGCGQDGIPKRWKDGVMEWPRTITWMRRLAIALAKNKKAKAKTGAIMLNIPGVMLRNAFFLVWVLLHGFRRILPPY
jgi:ADP-ribosyl-[dinitrogen reductase] hydrolase